MNQVRETMQLFLRSIPEGSLFNIISFGTKWKALFQGSREYNQKSLQEASEHVSSMEADMGKKFQ